MATRVFGKDLTTVSLADTGGTTHSVLAETLSISFALSTETKETETFGDQWKEFTAGLKGGDKFTHECFAGTEDGGTLDLYYKRLLDGSAQNFNFALPSGAGKRTISMDTVVTKVSTPVTVGDLVKLQAEHTITGAVAYSS